MQDSKFLPTQCAVHQAVDIILITAVSIHTICCTQSLWCIHRSHNTQLLLEINTNHY